MNCQRGKQEAAPFLKYLYSLFLLCFTFFFAWASTNRKTMESTKTTKVNWRIEREITFFVVHNAQYTRGNDDDDDDLVNVLQ